MRRPNVSGDYSARSLQETSKYLVFSLWKIRRVYLLRTNPKKTLFIIQSTYEDALLMLFITQVLETSNIYGALGFRVQPQFRWLVSVALHQGRLQ